ncbi:MAG TPA: GntR family transcriptional regulator [Candidatus Limnocylindrales bacterium]|jgi:GntR family transcriptional regulator|nr:GntR family transcriptional regulator [Candidatus Limnocylindrales bacterium]
MSTRAEGAAHEIERRVLMGEYPVGSQLPGENELASSVGISRTTLREAVGRLVAKGLLRREQGRGTYVHGRSGIRISMLLEANLSISDMIRDMGMTPETSEVEASIEVPPEDVALALGRPGLDKTLVLRRLRTADGEPAVYSVDYLIIDAGLPLDAASYRFSVYELLARHYGLPVTSGYARLRAGTVGEPLATKLHVTSGSLALVLSQVHALSDGRIVMYSDVQLRNDIFSVFVRRGSSESAADPTTTSAWSLDGLPSREPIASQHGGGT